MSDTLARIQNLVAREEIRISDHGYDELEQDGILVGEVLAGVFGAFLIEDYPDRARGPSVLTLQSDGEGRPIHVVWAIPTGERHPAVLVTGYRPDPALWDDEFKKRKKT
jgi:hypothetical protein